VSRLPTAFCKKAPHPVLAKNWCKNVGQIDLFSQFHQHFMSSFYIHQYSTGKKQSKAVIREKLCKPILYKKLQILVKSTPLVNFMNILRAAFAPIFFRQKITKQSCN